MQKIEDRVRTEFVDVVEKSEEIKCLDIIESINERNGRPMLNLAIVTLSRNNVYELHLNEQKLNLTQKMCGVTFMDPKTLVLHLENEIIIYKKDNTGRFYSTSTRPIRKKLK